MIGGRVLGIGEVRRNNGYASPPTASSSGPVNHPIHHPKHRLGGFGLPCRGGCRLTLAGRIGGLICCCLADCLIKGVAYATSVFHSSLSLTISPREVNRDHQQVGSVDQSSMILIAYTILVDSDCRTYGLYSLPSNPVSRSSWPRFSVMKPARSPKHETCLPFEGVTNALRRRHSSPVFLGTIPLIRSQITPLSIFDRLVPQPEGQGQTRGRRGLAREAQFTNSFPLFNVQPS